MLVLGKILPLLCLVLSAALLVHASYISVLGGSSFFFFFNLGLLLFINIYRHVEQYAWRYQSVVFLGLLLLALLSPILLHACSALLIYLLLLWIAYRWTDRALMPWLVLLCLLLLFVNQQWYLHDLQQHYAQYRSGETWQQYGAL